MTQVLKRPISYNSPSPREGQVVSVKHYEAKPPANLSSTLVDPDNVLATTKEEEWITKKKVELTTKKQIETRVKRQVVLEDGKVVEDSGPIVTTNTTEDTEKQEHEQTEHRQIGDDNPGEGWVAVPNSTGLVKEIRENKTKSREETEELLETEDVQHLGDITDEAYLKAIQSQKKDLRLALRKESSELLKSNGINSSNGRVVHHSIKNRKTIDTDDKNHFSEIQSDGKLITETLHSTQHEEIDNSAEPDDREDEEAVETHTHSSQKYRKTKEQELVEYLSNGVKIGEQMRYEAENVEGDRKGNPENLKINQLEWESLSERIRRMRREKQQKLEEAERMDALTKKPLNFDQEEETRKVETSKWLEHHFGSESRSSKSSGDDDEGSSKNKKTSTSFINVTMKSTKTPRPQSPPSKPVYFKGVSEWSASPPVSSTFKNASSMKTNSTKNVYEVQTGNIRKVTSEDQYQQRSLSPFQPIDEKSETLKVDRISSPISSPITELESSPLYASVQQKHNRFEKTSTGMRNGKTTQVNGILRSSSPNHKQPNGIIKTDTTHRSELKPSSVKKESLNKSWSRSERRLTDISDSDVQREPDPDYSPRLSRKMLSSPDVRVSPSNDIQKKKVYQKTRFAADIPLVKSKPTRRPERKSSIVGDTFRKLVGKFRSTSTDRKKSKSSQATEGSEKTNGSSSSYQAFDVADSFDSEASSGRSRRRSLGAWNGYESQTLDRRRNDMFRRNRSPAPVQKYYMGENPYAGSIYGNEKEYDGAKMRRKKHSGYHTDDEKKTVKNHIMNGVNNILGGRLSKSTAKLDNNTKTRNITIDYTNRGGIQTLPRKTKKQVFINDPSSDQENLHRRTSNSMINVSMVNNVQPLQNGYQGPEKPARTYRSSLLRSKSFNVQLGPTFKSNPQLHKLDSSPPPLKSPGIVTSISRSTRDLTDDDHRRTFMRGLKNRAPELYQTLHEDEELPKRATSTPKNRLLDYSSSFNTTRKPTVSFETDHNDKLNNDYSETVRYTSKSRDPARPSVTNTVQSFSKKTVPARDGRLETIESSETTRVTKSHFREPDHKYSRNGNGGVVIEVKNERRH